ncbi:hypothetical protein SAMN04487857_101392 [Pseudomonas sp. ok272]|uniref:amidase n=1 Tax=unclassified Pseudomonas TaxID=196821 RepID=UPI0008B6AD91|nr:MULTISPECIES: amidase [unclassified Pseudomonas]SEM37003.1 hypothetical protein SAMN04487857_101392 [Pseudomonas sp. ok272]SFM37376.1 hypothetical protein SAMN04487858_102394 [Pseudomonas sp. ok602]
MRLGWLRRHPILGVFLLLIVVLLGWAWQQRVALSAFPDIIGAYTAKEYCSCRYVANQPADYCRGYVKQWLATRGFVDDADLKRVTASGMGRSHSACWLGVRQGCQLTP